MKPHAINLVRDDDEATPIVFGVICVMIFAARKNILSTVNVEILMLVMWSYMFPT